MEHRHLDQRRVAERMETKEGTVSKLMNGKMKMTQEWLAAFAFAFNVDVTSLYHHPEKPTADEMLRQLPPEKRQQAIDYLEFLIRNAA